MIPLACSGSFLFSVKETQAQRAQPGSRPAGIRTCVFCPANQSRRHPFCPGEITCPGLSSAWHHIGTTVVCSHWESGGRDNLRFKTGLCSSLTCKAARQAPFLCTFKLNVLYPDLLLVAWRVSQALAGWDGRVCPCAAVLAGRSTRSASGWGQHSASPRLSSGPLHRAPPRVLWKSEWCPGPAR